MGTKNQRAVYEWVNISDDLVYEWVRFFKGQVYEWGRFRKTGSNTRTTITPKLTPPPPPSHPPPPGLRISYSSKIDQYLKNATQRNIIVRYRIWKASLNVDFNTNIMTFFGHVLFSVRYTMPCHGPPYVVISEIVACCRWGLRVCGKVVEWGGAVWRRYA